MVFYGRSSRRWSRSILTAAIPAAGSPASGVPTVGSSGAVFAAVDIAARPGVQFHHGLGGKFNAGKENSAPRAGIPHAVEKGNAYP